MNMQDLLLKAVSRISRARVVAVVGLFMVVSMLVPLGTASAVNCGSKPTFLGLIPWYQYLHVTDDGQGGCKITDFSGSDPASTLGGHSPFLLIALAIVDDLLRVATLIAVGYVIYGGFRYMTSNGSPDGTKNAQNTIIDAMVGLVIAIVATSAVSFLGNRLAG